MSTYPDQNFKGVDSIIYSPLNIIHQVVSGASDHHGWDGTILFICVNTNQHVNSERFKIKIHKPEERSHLPCLKTTTWVSPTSVRYTSSQWPISSGVGAV